MRIIVPRQPREFWRDRTPSVVAQGGEQAIAAGTALNLVDFTVVANRRMYVELVTSRFRLASTIPSGQNVHSRVRIFDVALFVVYDDLHVLEHAEGPGSYTMQTYGGFTLLESYRFIVQASASAVYGGLHASCWATGVEYNV